MPHIYFEGLERRQNTQALYGIPLFPEFIQFPQASQYPTFLNRGFNSLFPWGNGTGYPLATSYGFSNFNRNWSNPILTSSYPARTLWSGLASLLSPIRYPRALLSAGFGGSTFTPITAYSPPATTTVYIPPTNTITLLYGLFTPIPLPSSLIPFTLPSSLIP